MRGVSEIETDQKNCSYHFEKLRESGVHIFNIAPNGESIRFCISNSTLKLAMQYFEKCGVDIHIINDKRLKTLFKLSLRHMTLIVGIAAVVVIIGILSAFCFQIEVRCEDKEVAKRVEYLVKESKVVGKSKLSIDKKQIEQKIVESVENVAFAQVFFEGESIVVDVICHKDATSARKNFSKIVAKENAVISRVLCYSGTPLVKTGDTVKAGQTLIEGYIERGVVGEENYQKIPTPASGEVYARVWEREQLDITMQRIDFLRTGKSKTIYESLWMGKPLNSSKKCNFEYYEVEVKQVYLGGIFPIKTNVHVYYELAETIVDTDEAYIEKKLFEKKSSIVARLKDEEKICLDWKIEKKLDNLVHFDIYYEVERSVGGGVI